MYNESQINAELTNYLSIEVVTSNISCDVVICGLFKSYRLFAVRVLIEYGVDTLVCREMIGLSDGIRKVWWCSEAAIIASLEEFARGK
jgi:hypothetical protein